MDEVTKVLEKFVVVDVDELLPLELGVGDFRATREEVESPDIGVDAGVLGVVTEDTNTARLAELAVLVVEVLSGGNTMDLGPVLVSSELR